MQPIPWWLYAVLGAACAAMVSVLGKSGLRDLNSDLATAARAVVQAVVVVGFVAAEGLFVNLRSQLHGRGLMLVLLSGAAGGLSWLFMFRALEKADVSRVAPIDKLSMPIAVLIAVLFLGERPGAMNWLGVAMIGVGAYLAAR
jgi:transporter family protein